MPKINQEEYGILKGLDGRWEWITRDGITGSLHAYSEKPYKSKMIEGIWSLNGGNCCLIDTNLFQFIQWENEEPYNVAELIREYEKSNQTKFCIDVQEQFSNFEQFPNFIVKEETESNIEWALGKIDKYLAVQGNNEVRNALQFAKGVIRQLDEYEVLSQEWIDEHKEEVYMDKEWWLTDDKKNFVWVNDLQNLLVPKQELPVIPKFVAEWIEFKKKSGIPYENVFQAINELVNSHTSKAHNWVLKTDENKDAFARAWLDGYEVEEEQKYYVLDKENATLLKKSSVGEGVAKSVGTNIYNTKSWKNEEEYQLAEQEIKDYDERYWPFAVKVEELEK